MPSPLLPIFALLLIGVPVVNRCKNRMTESVIIITGSNEPDQYRRLERQLRDAAREIRLNNLRECDVKIRYDLNGMVNTELRWETGG